MERIRFSPAKRIAVILAASLAIVTGSGSAGEKKSVAANPPSPDSEAERVRSFLEDRVRRDPDDIIAQNRLAELYLQRLRATGDSEWLRRAGDAARRSLSAVPAEQNASGLYMQARVEYDSHHFGAARDLAEALMKIEPGKSRGVALLGDALLEFGDLDQAAAAYEEMQKRKGDAVETEARLARLDLMRGAHESSRAHLEKALQAAREAAPASAEVVGWCFVESGQMAFNTGQWDAAEKYFQSALAERPGDIAAQEHLAELRAAQGKYDEAILLYERVIARSPRPEFWQALGDVYAAMGKLAEAATWHARARDAYLKNAKEGNDHYFHHLAGFYSDTEENPAEALKWARKDLELRHSAAARDTLAWALYRDGQFPEAAKTAEAALASGNKDAHILFHVGMIFLAANDAVRGKEILAEAARVNPLHNSFHVHR